MEKKHLQLSVLDRKTNGIFFLRNRFKSLDLRVMTLTMVFLSFLVSAVYAQDAKKIHGLTEAQKDSLNHKSAASHAINYSAQDHFGTPRQMHVDKGWIGIPGTKSEIKLWGWVQAAAFVDFQGNYLNTAQEFSAGLVEVPTNSEGSFGFEAYSSRIFFETRHLLKGQAVKTMFVMDAGGGEAAGWAVPRIRQFYVSINNLTFGAANGTFANFNTWPGYFDRGAPGNFPLARKPVIRYGIPLNKKHKDNSIITIGVEYSGIAIANAEMKYKAPDIVARYDYNPKWGNIMVGGIARNINATSMDATMPGSDSKWVMGGQLSGSWTFGKKKDHIKGIFMAGKGVAGYAWDSAWEPGNSGFYDPATATINNMFGWSGFLSYEHNWSKRLYSNFQAAYVDISNIEGQPNSAFNHTTTYVATLRYMPWPMMFIAGEYMYGKRVNYDEQEGYDNRFNIIFRYIFNH